MQKFEQLYQVSQKSDRTIIGLMSGTSCDGLDVGIFRFSGFGRDTRFETIYFETVPMPLALKKDILSVLGVRQVDLQQLTILNEAFGLFTAQSVNEVLKKANLSANNIDCIASHGQTVFHAPRSLHLQDAYPNATLQIGDGDHIAKHTGILTFSDFRQKHIAFGGEGAPLAPYADFALFSSPHEGRVLLNIGGISNLTTLDKASRPIASDVGPGNTILNAIARKYFQKEFDQGGAIAQQGRVVDSVLNTIMDEPFFQAKMPKSTGQEIFNLNWFLSFFGEAEVQPEDLMATAAQLTVRCIADAIELSGMNNGAVYVSGGGIHNNYLIDGLRSALPGWKIQAFASLGISSDAKEALVFAYLANENFNPNPVEYPWEPSLLTMGKLSFPY